MTAREGRPYDDYGGHRTHPAAYDGAIERDCPACGAPAGELCTFVAQVLINRVPSPARRTRHHPCIARTKGRP